ncbi:hypothetical protein RJ639_044309 [Escallonia herrerae]|uniref:Uncharacterized protein n=1 Tax=Escallonia herrerae TaxID=1293975 RepID=A0AA89B029_9ASTE|nr:hypothetical protein RJ639_044309 [Escallonia herrerae]
MANEKDVFGDVFTMNQTMVNFYGHSSYNQITGEEQGFTDQWITLSWELWEKLAGFEQCVNTSFITLISGKLEQRPHLARNCEQKKPLNTFVKSKTEEIENPLNKEDGQLGAREDADIQFGNWKDKKNNFHRGNIDDHDAMLGLDFTIATHAISMFQANAALNSIQKLKLDTETAMLELNQILKANEINFAILAALPAFFVSLIIMSSVRAWFKRAKEIGIEDAGSPSQLMLNDDRKLVKNALFVDFWAERKRGELVYIVKGNTAAAFRLKDNRAEGRGRIARIQRRLLIVEVEKRITQFQTCIDQGLNVKNTLLFSDPEKDKRKGINEIKNPGEFHVLHEKDARCMFGLLLYSLDRLYRAVERHAKATGEWQW